LADISVGDISAKLTIDAAEWQRGLQQAIQSLQQFGQAKDRIVTNLGALQQSLTQNSQTFQQFNTQINQTSQAFNQTNQTINNLRQTFNQFNTQLNQTNQTFNQTNQTFNQTNQTLNTLNQTINNVTNNFNNASRGAQGASSAWSSIFQIAGGIGLATSIQGIVGALSNFVQESVTLAGSMENLHRSFTAIQGSGEAANRTLTALFTTAQRAGIGFTDAAEGFRRLQAGAATTVLTTDDLLKGFDNIARGATIMGLSTQQVSQAIVAFEQMLTKGRLSAEELVRQLGNAIPGGLARTAEGLGVTTERLRQMAEAGVIPSTVAFTAFQSKMGEMADAAGRIDGIAASFARLKNEMAAWATAVGGWLSTAILPMVKAIADLSEELRRLFNIRAPGVTGGGRSRWDEPEPPAGFAREMAALNPVTMSQRWGQAQQRQAKASTDLEALIQFWSSYRGFDPNLIRALASRESNLDPAAKGPIITKGPLAGDRAYGLMQMMGTTGAGYGASIEDLLDASKSLDLGTRHLAGDIKRITDAFGNLADVVPLALAAYNAGFANVRRGLETLRAQDKPLTWENFAALGKNVGLPQPEQTIPYVRNIMRMREAYQGGEAPIPGAGAAAPAVATEAALTKTWRLELEGALKQFGEIKRQVDALATSGMNFNGILSQGINQQANRLVERLSTISNFFAAFPDEAAKMSQELRDQSTAAFQQAAIWKESLLTETQRRDLGRQQVEQLEQVISRQKAMLISQREGQEAAERFSRLDAARLAAARIDDRTARAGLTPTQQIARDADRLQALQQEANQLGADLEARRVETMRPQLESQLQRMQALIGHPDQSLAEQARQQVVTQFTAAQAEIIKLIQQTAQHPDFQNLQEAFQNAFQALPEAMAAQSTKAFEAVERQTRDTLRSMTDQFDQITMQLGAAGLDPLAADLSRIDRSFAGLLDKVQALDAALEKLGVGATAEQQGAIAALRERLSLITEARVAEGRLAAEAERRDRDLLQQRESVERTRESLINPEQRESTRMRQRLARGGFTEQGEREARELLRQQEALERVTVTVGLWRDLSQGVGSAWVAALTSIADHTATVAEAFRAMGQSILKTLADIAAQQAEMAIFKLGVGLLTGALTGAVSPGAAASSAYQASAGTQSYGAGAFFGGLEAQGGAVVTRPTTVLMGENPAMNPEYVLNRHQMQALTSNGGQNGGVSIHNYPSKAEAEAGAASDRAQGHVAVVNAVLTDLSNGSGSKIGRAMRLLQQ
jgi:tape measure domain-containing protein